MNCKCTGKKGQKMESNGCEMHTELSYKCDICTTCFDYKPNKDIVGAELKWPRCMCGHAAEDHN